ncbi:unnamed protein product [Hymenolepis diminuta]|uniref:Uncharacterized protein n=1 Tax=Hymenolepis diminuta TaxID=6216 RepID=A0A564Z4U5_HYMDI|nr:unnamed protein product [Hymenolepis diminuta]
MVPKPHKFTRRDRLQGSILQERSPLTCQPLHKFHWGLLNFNPSTMNCGRRGYQKQHSMKLNICNLLAVNDNNQAAEQPPIAVDYLLFVNPNSVLPGLSPAVPFYNVRQSITPAQSSSKDTVQPSSLSA